MSHSSLRSLQASAISTHNFSPYGQVLWAQSDGKPYDNQDAQLQLDQGIPRLYIMKLENQGLKFHRITYHRDCTQCLGSLNGLDWLMAVAPSGEVPTVDNLRAFKIPGDCFIKLDQGTWHAGPYFRHESVSFYNLELSDTNQVDHHTYDFLEEVGCVFEIIGEH